LKAIYDSTLKQFILKRKETGAQTQISISSSDTSFLDTTLGFSGPKDTDNAYGFNRNGISEYVTEGSLVQQILMFRKMRSLNLTVVR
jgi:hypothetical protein